MLDCTSIQNTEKDTYIWYAHRQVNRSYGNYQWDREEIEQYPKAKMWERFTTVVLPINVQNINVILSFCILIRLKLHLRYKISLTYKTWPLEKRKTLLENIIKELGLCKNNFLIVDRLLCRGNNWSSVKLIINHGRNTSTNWIKKNR